MNKKRMKFYFASLPRRTSVKIAHDVNFESKFPGGTSAFVTHDLSEYAPVSLRHPNASDASGIIKPVNVEDIKAALSDMLPLVSYQTTTMTDLSKNLLRVQVYLQLPPSIHFVRLPAKHISRLLSLVFVQVTLTDVRKNATSKQPKRVLTILHNTVVTV